jgi:hypothetical protein
VPLGFWRLKALPRPWVNAAWASAGVLLALSAWAGTFSAAARVMFTMLGPVLSLSAAVLLQGLFKVGEWQPGQRG